MTYYVRAGVRVDKKHSDERQVTLKDLSMKSTGRYRCEVSTEAPTFETVSSYGDMIVVGKEWSILQLYFKEEHFLKLYHRWIEMSILGIFAWKAFREVFVYLQSFPAMTKLAVTNNT